MAFVIGLPVVQIILFCLSIGKDPIGLKLAVVNNELENYMDPCSLSTGCDMTLLSCRYMQHIKNRSLVLVPYETDADAKYAVKKGWAWAAVNFPANYTDSLVDRLDNGKDASEWSVLSADVDITMDMSSECLNIRTNMNQAME